MDREILKYYIEEYKEDFDRINQDEIYKWYIVTIKSKNIIFRSYIIFINKIYTICSFIKITTGKDFTTIKDIILT